MQTKRILSQETFPAAALRLFREKVRGQVAFVVRWCWWIEDVVVWITPDATHLVSFYEFSFTSLLLLLLFPQSPALSIAIIAVILICTISTAALTIEALSPRWDGLLSSFWKCTVAPVLVIFVLWMVFYVGWQVLCMLIQFSLFFPMFLLFGLMHRIQRYRKVFVCPVRKCSDMSLPAHVCRACGQPHDDLYPNLYGLFWHRCAKCGELLPTLNLLGRRELARRCRHCRLPRSHRTLPTRLVQIVGGVSSGKTCYLIMVIHQIINGEGRQFGTCGAIDDPDQKKAFLRQWGDLAMGKVVAKTIEVPRAWLLYVQRQSEKPFQLYLYDGPGEEYESVAAMETQQYFSELNGIVLLVDPKSFEAVSGPAARSALPFDEVVSTIVGRAVLEMRPTSDNRFDLRVAVAISKADLPEVRRRIGDIRLRTVEGCQCRQAIAEWGGGNALRVIEQRFKSVEFFACSALGRDANECSGESFTGVGLLDPLHWALTGDRCRSAVRVPQ